MMGGKKIEKISIFNLEKRFDWEIEFYRLHDFITEEANIEWGGIYYTLSELVDEYMEDFPLSGSARDIGEFFNDFGIYEIEGKAYDLQIIHFYLTFLLWFASMASAKKKESSNMRWDYTTNILDFTEKFNKRLDYFLEAFNYKKIIHNVDEELDLIETYFIKRNVEVDTMLDEVDSEVRIRILTYIDFRNEKNLTFKVETMRQLYVEIEKEKDILIEVNRKLYDDTKFILNLFRHNNEKIKDLEDSQLIELADIGFDCFIHLTRESKILKHRQYIKQYKI